jgi:hypothetical protein
MGSKNDKKPENVLEETQFKDPREYVFINLPTMYTDEEMAKLGEKLAKVLSEIDETQQDLKSYAAEKKAHLESLAGQRQFLVLGINRGLGWKDVECRVMKDYTLRTKSIVRMDTGEVVEVKPLTLEDIQTDMDLEAATWPHKEEGAGDA